MAEDYGMLCIGLAERWGNSGEGLDFAPSPSRKDIEVCLAVSQAHNYND